jgi:hypothetical protein
MKKQEKNTYTIQKLSSVDYLILEALYLKSNYGMNAFTLKMIAVVAMTIDHIGALLFPDALWLRIIGRLAMPIMAFLVVEGYHNTGNLKRYLLRLLIFAVIAQPVYRLAFPTGLNVLFDLLVGLCLIWLVDRIRLPWVTYLLIVIAGIIGFVIELDWWHLGLMLILIFHKTRGRFKYTVSAISTLFVVNLFVFATVSVYTANHSYVIINAINLGGVLAFPVLFLYNGLRGFDCRYFFYCYYPIHLLILCGVKQVLFRAV